jgi:CHAT domain-containing protein
LGDPVAFWTGRRIGVALAVGAAAVVALLVATGLVQPAWFAGRTSGTRPELAGLVVAMAVESVRGLEGRLTGGFPYAPSRALMRGEALPAWSPDVRVAAATLERQVQDGDAPEHAATRGVLHAILGDLDRARTELERAVGDNPADARYQSDLSAVYLERARVLNRPEEYPRALTAAERAVALMPSLSEGWFNRALILEQMQLPAAAGTAWKDALARESDPRWTAEIRDRAARAAVSPSRPADDSLPQWRAAADSDTPDALRALAAAVPQNAREFLDNDLLVRWGEAVLRGDVAGASRLHAASAVVAAVLHDRGDRLPASIVTRLAGASAPERTELARGYVDYGRGRNLSRKGDAAAAIEAYDEAAQRLKGHDGESWGWAVLARSLATYQQGDLASTAARLEPVHTRAAERQFLALAARTGWIIGLVHTGRAEYTEALRYYRAALTAFERLGEADNLAFVHNLLSQVLNDLGDTRGSWDHVLRGLRVERIRPATRHSLLMNAATIALEHEMAEAALHLQNALLDGAIEAGAGNMLVEAYYRRAAVHATSGRHGEATADLARAREALATIPDPGLSRRLAAEIAGVEGDIACRATPREAIAQLSTSIEFFAGQKRDRRLPLLHLRRGRCVRALGRLADARNDFSAGIALFEDARRAVADATLRVSYLDEQWDLYADLAGLLVKDMQDPLAALAVAERARRSEPGAPDLASVQRVLPADTAIVYYLALPDALAIWSIGRETWHFTTVPLGEQRLTALVTSYRDALRRTSAPDAVRRRASELFDRLLRPAMREIGAASSLVIVPDGALTLLPFASLVDASNGRYLVERVTLSFAPSLSHAAVHLNTTPPPAHGPGTRLFAVAGPGSAADGLPPLPGAAREVVEIGRMYGVADVVDGRATVSRFLEGARAAEVVHFAGHAVASTEMPRQSRLVLHAADDPALADSLFADAIAGTTFPRTRLVVLSACDTAVGPVFHGEGTLSLARPFLNAGVPAVLATLFQVDDEVSRRISVAFHERVLRGMRPSAALRDVQRELIADGGVHSAAWSAFVMFGM